MSANIRKSLLLAGLVFTLCASTARAQWGDYVDTPDHELQFFAPVDLDYDNLQIQRKSGYYFQYDKLSWAFTGERVEVGDPDVVEFSEIIYQDTSATNPAAQEGTAPQPYQIQNGLKDVSPDAEFAWGERYEFGYFNKNAAWTIGIIDGPEAVSQATYGFGTGASTIAGGDYDGGSLAGFGSVHVNFETPPDYLLGFRDYYNLELDPDLEDLETLSGPMVRIGVAEDQFLEVTDSETIITDGVPVTFTTTTFIPNPNVNPEDATKLQDEEADDLDRDGIAGFATFLDPNGNALGTIVDFDDLHRFNIRFDTFFVRNISETQGIELMKTHRLTNRHHMVKHQNNHLDFGYGVRFLRLRDEFFFEGNGGILGRTFADTSAENQIVGPQIRGTWRRQQGRWNLAVDGRCLFGYNVQDLDQVGAIGEALIPGGLNSLVGGQPTAFSYGRQENDFSPVAELRADLSYNVTRSIAARLGYTAIFVDNITRASQTVRWALPDMGLLEAGNQHILINGANFGFDVTY